MYYTILCISIIDFLLIVKTHPHRSQDSGGRFFKSSSLFQAEVLECETQGPVGVS